MAEMGFFFPQPSKLKPLDLQDLKDLEFRGKRLDLQVYHLAYGTKKLRACTYKRMAKRQQKINDRKKTKLIVKSPSQIKEKGQKEEWLNRVQDIIVKNSLQYVDKRKLMRMRRFSRRRKANLQPRPQNSQWISPTTAFISSINQSKQSPQPVVRTTPKINPPIPGFASFENFPTLP